MIREELDRLPDSYRQPLTLCYMEGLTHQEAASRLGWPVGTVKVRLVRGRRLLRERLDRRGASLGGALLLWLLNPEPGAGSSATALGINGSGDDLGRGGPSSGARIEVCRRAADGRRRAGRRARPEDSLAWPVVVLAVIMLGFTGSAALAFHGKPAPDVDPTTLPANLTDILNVDCG